MRIKIDVSLSLSLSLFNRWIVEMIRLMKHEIIDALVF